MVRPDEAWLDIKSEKGTDLIFGNFVYPLMALTAFVTFVCQLLYAKGDVAFSIFQTALTNCCATAVALLGGVYLTISLLDFIFKLSSLKGLVYSREQLTKLVCYSFVVVFLYFILSSILPELSGILFLLQLYIIYVVWQGMNVIVFPEDSKKMMFTWIIGVAIVIIPSLLNFIFIKSVNLIN